MSEPEYTTEELMVTAAARELTDGEMVMVGLGLPSIASNLAKRTNTPDIQQIYEPGIIGADPPGEIPRGVSGPELVAEASGIVPMFEVFGTLLQNQIVDVAFLGGAQVDKYGNINSTVIGDYDDPDVRLPGSGGAHTMASNAGRTLIVMPQERRRFPAEVDFITSPGYIGPETDRHELGLRGGGPEMIISTKAIFRFDDAGEAYVDSLHPGASKDEVREATGWDVEFADDLGTTAEPTPEDIHLIRDVLDPNDEFIERP